MSVMSRVKTLIFELKLLNVSRWNLNLTIDKNMGEQLIRLIRFADVYQTILRTLRSMGFCSEICIVDDFHSM